MRFTVNETCIGCGMCAGTCPEVFSMTVAGVAQASTQEVPAEAEAAAVEAQANCPVGAIEKIS